MKEVGVEVRRAGRQLGGEHAGLAEAPAAVRRRIAPDVAEPQAERSEVAAGRARERPGVAGEHAPGRLVEVLRQVRDRRPDRPVDGVRQAIVGAPERDEVEREPLSLERGQLVRDERLRDAGVALEDHDDQGRGDRGPHGRGRR